MGRADGGIRKFRDQLDENPEWRSDLLALYNFNVDDVFAGRAPLVNALALIQRLPFEPWSMFRAEKLGGPEHLGWSPDTYLSAENVDATMIGNAIAANQGSRKRPKMPEPVWRPGRDKEPEAPKSLMDLPIAAMAKAINGGN